MQRYKIVNDTRIEDEHGVFVMYGDMLVSRIEMQKKHLEIVTQYQETIDAIRAELR